MLVSQKKLVDVCGKLTEVSENYDLPQTYSDEARKLALEIETRQLVVPVVGAFSAGKSTLINNCIGRKVLPVDITPETSLATELHYSETEYAEAMSKDGATTRYEIGNMPKLRDEAAKYTYAKVYLNSPILKKIEPLILVDMPGFDSPLDDHNKAILQYLDKGCYYIVLSSGVEEKTPSASLIRRLREITAMERDFSFYISKSNMLGTQNELDAILQHYKQTLSDNLDRDVKPRPVGQTETEAEILSLFESVDPEKLMLNLYRNSVKGLCFEAITLLNVRISALQKSEEENRSDIKVLEEQIRSIEKKAEELIREIKERYSGGAVNDIVTAAGKALDAAIDEIMTPALRGDSEGMGRVINEIVRESIAVSTKSKLGTIAENISLDFSASLPAVDFGSGADSQNAIFDTVSEVATRVLGAGDGQGSGVTGGQVGGAYKIITALGGLLTGGTLSIIEMAVVFLPEILGPIFGYFKNKRQKQELTVKLQTEVFPSIKRSLRTKLPPLLEKTVSGIIAQIKEQYAEQNERQRQEIAASIETAKVGAEETARLRAQMEQAIDEVKLIADKLAA